jgi:hypothetical protein
VAPRDASNRRARHHGAAMRHPLRILLLALALLAFLAISAALARILSANGAERSAIERLLDAQARGDAAGVVARIDGCAASAGCRAEAQANAARLRSTGALQIVRLDPSTSFSLGGTEGVARVVWKTPSRLTVVQCVRVRRGGDVLHGLRIELRALSRPIPRESSCPSAG